MWIKELQFEVVVYNFDICCKQICKINNNATNCATDLLPFKMNKCQKLRMQNLRVGTIVVFLPFTLSICQGETISRFFMKAKTAFLHDICNWYLRWKRHVLSLDQVMAGCIIWFIEVCNSAWDKLFKVTGPTLHFFYCFIACLEGGWWMIKTENNAVHKIHRHGDGSLDVNYTF